MGNSILVFDMIVISWYTGICMLPLHGCLEEALPVFAWSSSLPLGLLFAFFTSKCRWGRWTFRCESRFDVLPPFADTDFFFHNQQITASWNSRGVNIYAHALWASWFRAHMLYTGTPVQRRNSNRLYRFKSNTAIAKNTGISPNINVEHKNTDPYFDQMMALHSTSFLFRLQSFLPIICAVEHLLRLAKLEGDPPSLATKWSHRGVKGVNYKDGL